MSRIAKSLISVPKGVGVTIDGKNISIKGQYGSLSYVLNSFADIEQIDDTLKVIWDSTSKVATSQAGTARALINNMVHGVSVGFEQKLTLIGVGYRAQAKDSILSLSLGYSHPIEFLVPIGITIETPVQTEILIKGIDKQLVGQVAADIRGFRPPEPYKGKGVRYFAENVARKEAKKK
ncbi:MAG: 50S ribosomal protein L6 [Methylococcaceae bacterium]|nr:50S ribosomal protein L6 [Methylococcaceae bacterium]